MTLALRSNAPAPRLVARPVGNRADILLMFSVPMWLYMAALYMLAGSWVIILPTFSHTRRFTLPVVVFFTLLYWAVRPLK